MTVRLTALVFLTSSAMAAGLAGCDKDEKPEPKKAAAPAKAAAPKEEKKADHPPVPEPPDSLGRIKTPDDNPTTPAKVALGHKLFFDKRLSVDGSRACYSCHQNEDGTGGHEPTAVGAEEKELTRHAPVMWNLGYLPRLYWDGRAESLEDVSRAAWSGANMGVGEEGLQKKADEIAGIEEYKKAFDEAFPGDGVMPATIVKALAAYQRTLFCGDTAYDKFAAGDKKALTSEQQKGWDLFKGKAGCNNCHVPPFFSDAYTTEKGVYHNVGIGIEGKSEEEIDVGRMKVTENPSDWASFKTPTLRNVTRSPPYFHNGSRAELEEAVRFMAGGGYKNKNLDPKLEDKKLSDEEVEQLVAFLGGLECSGKLEEPKLP